MEYWPALLCVLDFQHRFKQVNNQWSRLGISTQVLLTTTFTHWIHPDDLAVTEEVLIRLQDEEIKPLNFETRWRNAKGEYHWILWSAATLFNELSIYMVGIEATEYHSQEQQYRAIVNHLPEGILMYDAQGKIQFCNHRAEQLLGRAASELLGQSEWPTFTITPDGNPVPVESHPALVTLQTDKPCHDVVLGLKIRDEVTWLSLNTQPLRLHEAATSDAVVVSLHDISEHKHQEEALQDRLHLLYALFESTAIGIAVLDDNGRFTKVNPAYSQFYGYPAQELLGQPLTAFLPPPIRKEAALYYSNFSSEVQVTHEIWPVQHRDGQWLKLPTVESQLTLPNHKPFKALWIMPPSLVTTHSAALDSPWQAEWLALLFKHLQITVLGLDREGYLILARGSQLELLGLTEVKIGQSVFTATSKLPGFNSDLERALSGESFSKWLSHAGVTLEANFLAITRGSDWAGTLIIFRDVSEVRWLRSRLKSALQELELMAPHSGIGIIYVEGQKMVRVNPASAVLLGYSENELLKTTMSSLFQSSHDYHYLQTQAAPYLTQATPYHSQQRLRQKNGALVSCRVTIKPVSTTRTLWLLENLNELSDSHKSVNLPTAFWMTSTEAMLITDTYLQILQANSASTMLTGYTMEELLNSSLPKLDAAAQPETPVYQAILESLAATGQWQGQVWQRRKNQAVYICELKLQAYQTESATRYLAVLSKPQTSASAILDPLTHLPTRLVFQQGLLRTHAIAQRHVKHFAILLVSLDALSEINLNYGGVMGDLVLQAIGQTLRTSVRESDTVARYDGNRFGISLEEISKPQDAGLVAQMVLFKLSQPLLLNHQTIQSSASIGIVVYPEDGDKIDTLLELAQVAMQRAKQRGGLQCCFHNADLENRLS